MFGENLKKYRTAKGLSQNDLAEKLFVTRQCVSKWEQNVTQPDLQTLEKLGALLEVSTDALLSGASDENGRKSPQSVNRAMLILNVLAAVFCAVAYLVVWRFMPLSVPAHWTHGVIDRYASRDEIFLNVTVAAVFFALSLILFFALRRIIDKRALYLSHGCVALFQIAFLIFIIAVYARYLTDVLSFVTLLTVDLVMCLSVVMHPCIGKPNMLIGVRTAETLGSERVWKKANALACYLFVGCSLIIFAVNMAVSFRLSFLCLLAYPVLAVVPIIYAKVVGKSDF